MVSSLALLAVLAGPALSPAGAQAAGPSVLGAFSAPFEEGGDSPACVEVDGRVVCKPTAVSLAVLNDGRVLYFNGIESSENGVPAPPNVGVWARDARSRTLDLRGASPRFAVPTPENGGGTNPNVGATDDPVEIALGMLGAPGRPGDGLVGSTIGQFYPASPWASPDDPAANEVDMFCSDLAHLADGRLLIAGGTDWYSEPGLPSDAPAPLSEYGVPELEGIRTTRVFDPKTNRFSPVMPMKYGRWYPTMVTLADGRVFTAGGVFKLVKNSQLSNVRRTETFDPRTMRWTENYTGPASENSLPLYPRLHLVNGKVFYVGAGQANGLGPTGWAADEALWSLQQFFDPRTSEWEISGPAPLFFRNGAFSVMLPLQPPYHETRLLVGGGSLGPTPGMYVATPFSELVTIGHDDAVTTEMTGDMGTPRWFSTAVVLPDGTVAAFSGANADEVLAPGPQIPVRRAELFDPATGEWSPLATAARDRTYHNSAVLLPDGRVLVGGHSPIPAGMIAHMDPGGPFANNDKDASFEVFSPPYLFRGPRPSIAYAPSGVKWGSSFQVRLAAPYDGGDVDSVVLVRLPDQTHTLDADQRNVELSFTGSGRTLKVKAPPSGEVAPPGPYYLFVNRKSPKGPIPSVARLVTVGRAGTSVAARTPLRDSTRAASGGAASEPRDSSLMAALAEPVAGGLAAVPLAALATGLARRRRRPRSG